MDERPNALRTYLKTIESRKTPARRLADFSEAFGSDLASLEDTYQFYVADLIKQHYKTRK